MVCVGRGGGGGSLNQHESRGAARKVSNRTARDHGAILQLRPLHKDVGRRVPKATSSLGRWNLGLGATGGLRVATPTPVTKTWHVEAWFDRDDAQRTGSKHVQ